MTEPTDAELRAIFEPVVFAAGSTDDARVSGYRALYNAGVAAERERCAQVAIDMARDSHWNTGNSNTAHLIAAAIRTGAPSHD